MKPPLPHRREAMSFVLLMTLILAAVASTAGKTREPQRLGEYDGRPARHGYSFCSSRIFGHSGPHAFAPSRRILASTFNYA
jgi:hypothetical protein